MSRRSERLKSVHTAATRPALYDSSPPDSDSEYYDATDQDFFASVAPRRTRTGSKRGQIRRLRGKRGSLQRMLEIPLDVLFEVCPAYSRVTRGARFLTHCH